MNIIIYRHTNKNINYLTIEAKESMNKNLNTHKISGIFTPNEKNEIPEVPGVYIYKNKDHEIIYIGKAKNLKKRISSYFLKTHLYLKTHLLVQQISLIDIIVVENEQEALLLEATLIKKHLPKFNIDFKDGKFYPYIKITSKDTFPRIIMTRNKTEDGSIYFGPYVSAGVVRSNLDLLHKVFQLRTCKQLPKKECIEYHMDRCAAPCIGNITKEEYLQNIKKAQHFLEGNKNELLDMLEEKMKLAVKELLFEKAQIYKERIDSVLALDSTQNVYFNSTENIDIIGIQQHGSLFGIAVSLIKQGKLSGKLGFTVKNIGDFSISDILGDFITTYYTDQSQHPNRIIIGDNFEELALPLSEWFDNNDISISVTTPENDQMQSLLSLSEKNALIHLERASSEPDLLETLSSLQSTLKLKNFPSVIEGFDIAKLDGTLGSGVVVQFQGGEPNKEEYRLFNIRQENQQDDYLGMEEIVYRRYKSILDNEGALPQLIVIDGGKGQLSSALKALKKLNIDSIDVISIAKEQEEIFKPRAKIGIILPKNSNVLHLLQRVRDESHRFSQFQLHRRMDNKLIQ